MSDTDAALFRSRAKLIQAAFEWSPLDVVAEAISEATEHERRVYAERLGDQFRWSFVHPGGGYPLLRITARYMGVDYHRIIVGFRTLENGLAILFDDRADETPPDRWAILNFQAKTAPDEVATRVKARLTLGVVADVESLDVDRPGISDGHIEESE